MILNMDKKIILSTDIGSDVDDALALLTILNSKEINLKGIYTVNGDVDSRAYIAKHLIDLSGRKDIVVARGESSSLCSTIKPYYNYEDCLVDKKFVKDIEDNVTFKPLKSVDIISNGVEDLAERLSRENYIIFSIGPLTNIAKLIQDHPELSRNIDQIYIMGFRFGETNNEHNVRYDPEAAKLILETNIPLTIVPGDLCSKYRMPLKIIKNIETKQGSYVKKMVNSFIAIKTAHNFVTCTLPGTSFNLAGNRSIESIIKDKLTETSSKELDGSEILRLRDERIWITNNLNDPYSAAFDPETYFKDHGALIEQLKDPRLGYKLGNCLASIISSLVPKDLSVADAYIPYCFLHPEKLRTEKGIVTYEVDGETSILPGDKHEIVMDLDFKHFEEFLKTYLR